MLQGANGKHRHPFFGAVCYRQKDNVIQADVRGPEGFSRYFFNELGYETGLDFKPVKGSGWTYERKRNPNSNASGITQNRPVRVTSKPANGEVSGH
jgi:hypothetical protein